MKTALLAAIAMLSLLAVPAFASPQDVDAFTAQGSCEVAEAPTGEELEWANADVDAEGDFARGYWHCTAYPEGHGHHHGFDYRDIHYSHAYRGAMMRCERATHHHCHDVHCHFDHH